MLCVKKRLIFAIFATMSSMDFLSLPVVALESIFSYLSSDEIAKNRLVRISCCIYRNEHFSRLPANWDDILTLYSLQLCFFYITIRGVWRCIDLSICSRTSTVTYIVIIIWHKGVHIQASLCSFSVLLHLFSYCVYRITCFM